MIQAEGGQMDTAIGFVLDAKMGPVEDPILSRSEPESDIQAQTSSYNTHSTLETISSAMETDNRAGNRGPAAPVRPANSSSSQAFPTPMRPKPVLFSPGLNSQPFTPLTKQYQNTLRSSPYAARQGHLDLSLLSSPPPASGTQQRNGTQPPSLFSPGPWGKIDQSLFEHSALDTSTHRTETQYQTHGYTLYTVDLHSSLMMPDPNNASTDLPSDVNQAMNWSFSEPHSSWRV
jgi:hypothetical protein